MVEWMRAGEATPAAQHSAYNGGTMQDNYSTVLPIASIRLDGGTQPRACMDAAIMAEYASEFETGVALPPVAVFFDGEDHWLADGFHRLGAAKAAGLETIDATVKQGSRRDAVLYSVGANAEHGLRRTNADKRRAVETLLRDPEWSQWSNREIARQCAVSEGSVRNAIVSLSAQLTQIETPRKVTRNGTTYDMDTAGIGKPVEAEPQLFDAPSHPRVVAGEADILEAAKQIRDAKAQTRRAERVEALNKIEEGNAPMPVGSYHVIYADPPWRYEHVKTASRAIENHYPTMTLEDICALPVGNLAHEDAVLFMWATSPKLAESMRVITDWGFTYRTCLVWVKDRIGMGYYARQRHELLLVAARGSLPVPEPATRRDSVITAPRDEHSAKPDEAYEAIEAMYPGISRIELFCRRPRDGWSAWGNQV